MTHPMPESVFQTMNPPQPAPRRFARHPLNIGHLVMGLAFLGLVGIWALVQADAVTGDDIRWLLPVPWVLAGVAGLLASTLSGRGREPAGPPPRMDGWVDTPADHEPFPQTDQQTDTPTDQQTDPQETR